MSRRALDIHPFEFLDKSLSELSLSERQRRDAHLEVCSDCRLELQLREDFREELPGEHIPLPVSVGPTPVAFSQPDPSEELQLALGAATHPDSLDPPVLSAGDALPARPPQRWMRRGAVVGAAALFFCGISAASQLDKFPRMAKMFPISIQLFSGDGTAEQDHKKSENNRQAVAPTPVAPALEGGLEDANAPEVIQEALEQPVQPKQAPLRPSRTNERQRKASQSVAPQQTNQPQQTNPKALPSSAEVFPNLGKQPASESFERATSDASPETAGVLFGRATAARRNRNFGRAQELYQRLISKHPTSPEAETARALLARMELDQGKYDAAASSFGRVAADKGPLGEAALVGQAQAFARLGNAAKEAAAWEKLLRKFPHSAHRRLALQRLQVLRNQ